MGGVADLHWHAPPRRAQGCRNRTERRPQTRHRAQQETLSDQACSVEPLLGGRHWARRGIDRVQAGTARHQPGLIVPILVCVVEQIF